MITTFVAALLALASVQSTDTIVPVREGMRLDLRNREGDIRVTAWTRDEVEIVHGPDGVADLTIRAGRGRGDRPLRRTHRRFLPSETREVRLYLHGGNDEVQVTGEQGRSRSE